MRNLTLQRLVIISSSEKKARIIEFDPNFTVFTSCLDSGESLNRTGKSLALKSIYHSLGGNLSTYPINWKDLKISTIANFKIDKQKFMLFRENDKYLLTNEDNGQQTFYDGDELTEFYKEHCNYNISLQIHNADKVYLLPPSGLFLPYFMDQDAGWNSNWKSFNDLAKYKDAVKELLYFHTGVHSSEYYSILEKRLAYINEKSDKTKEKDILTKIFEKQIEKYANILDVEVDIKAFQKELDIFLEEINKNIDQRNKIKNELININREIIQLQKHIINARNVLNDLSKDIEYLNKQNETVITCPICGTEHENSLDIKYGIYRDKEDCETIISESIKELTTLGKKKNKIISIIPKLNHDIDILQSLLSRKQGNISLENAIEVLGIKNITESLKGDIKVVSDRLVFIEIELTTIKASLTKLTKNAKNIHENFSKKLNSNFINLEVVDEDYLNSKKIPYKVKSTGSDSPRGILALLFSYYDIIQKNPYATVCPIVIDSPFQQEQGSQKTHIIMNVIQEKQPANSQIIVATTERWLKDENIKVYNFIDEKKILLSSDYERIQETLSLCRASLVKKFSENLGI